MLAKLLSSVALTLLIVGCGCRDEAASSAEGGPPLAPAKRWQAGPPGQEPPKNVQQQAETDPGNAEGEPADDPRYPPEHDQSKLAKADPRKPGEDEPRQPAEDEPREPVENDPREAAAADPREPAELDAAGQTEKPGGEGEATSSNQKPGVITLRTDDCDAWPSYDWPLEINVELLELPERITKPAPPIEDD